MPPVTETGGVQVRKIPEAVAAAALVASFLAASSRLMDDAIWLLAVPVVPTSVLAGWRLPKVRSTVFAVGAGYLATWTPALIELWPAVAALVFFSIVEDKQERPWRGWLGGLGGSTIGMVFVPPVTPAAVLATAIGGGCGLLVRSWSRTRELAGEADSLRGQAAWLEQRTAVARELHDVVHHVTAMVVQAEAGRLGDPHEALATIGDLGRTALKELDSLVVHLRDPQAPLTVNAPPRLLDIDELLAEPLRRSGVQVEVRVQDGLGLDEVDVLAVYRIAQEALTNVARHAGARHAWVEVSRHDDRVRVRVSDDGSGPPEPRPARGSGLLGIEERVLPRGGAVELIGRPGGGSILDVTLPVES